VRLLCLPRRTLISHSVAVAATASTLLAPSTPQAISTRTTATSVLQNVLSRVRPSRLRSSQTVESVLGHHLRNVLRDNRRLDSSRTITAQASAEAADTNISNEFQAFLETLQADLVGAVREFAGISGTSDTVTHTTVINLPDDVLDPTGGSDTTTPQAIPTIHHQVGQIQPSNQRTSGVTGGTDETSRRLNFFRAHTFPSVPAGADENDPNAVVPCIFIAVRSIRHDPTMSTEDLVRHPSFPFVDGHVPSTSGQNNESTEGASINNTADTASVVSTTGRRSLRQRFMDRLSTPRQPAQPTGPLNTYLVSVIGGNYPRSHPVLAIPNLLTGGPLTDEEMQLVGDLMGPVKPPTATVDQIEKAGLKVVDGSEMADLAEKNEMLQSCVERCLVSL